MKIILLILFVNFFVFNLIAENLEKQYYAVSSNIHGHIFKIELKILKNNKVSILHHVCFRCLRFSKKIKLKEGFVKVKCINKLSDKNLFSIFCNSNKISTGIYNKQIKGNYNQAFMSGGNALHETEFPYGTTFFTFLNHKEFINYKRYLKKNIFITTQKYKLNLINEKLEKILIDDNNNYEKEKIRLNEVEQMYLDNIISYKERNKLREKILGID